MGAKRCLFPLALLALSLRAQDAPAANNEAAMLAKVLQRLDSLERENRELVKEVHALRAQIGGAGSPAVGSAAATGTSEQSKNSEAPAEERLAVVEARQAEQAQTKVEAAQKFPVTLEGTLLFNSFLNSSSATYMSPGYSLLSGPARSGATLRQTILGLRFDGPDLPGGGQMHGSVTMDFGAGYAEPGGSWIRLRRGDVSLDWADRSFSFRQDKPLISPYQPDSLAEVIVPPLAGAGNLWLWLPQARYEERRRLGESSGLTGQFAFLQTDERYESVPEEYAASLASARPAYEGRIALWHKWDDTHRFELAPGFHVSSSRVAGASVKSRIGSLDWRATPFWKLEWSGTFYKGQNTAGLGSIGNGFTIFPDGTVRPVRSTGGWTQIGAPLTSRLTLNLFAGLESDRAHDLVGNAVARNFDYAANLMYRLGPNVLLSFEGMHVDMRRLSGVSQNGNHYDLALAYLF